MKHALLYGALLLALAVPRPGHSAPASPAQHSVVRVSVEPVSVGPGGKGKGLVTIAVDSGWHVQANPPSDRDMIATVVKLQRLPGIRAGKPKYPAGELHAFPGTDEKMRMYQGSAVVEVPLVAARVLKAGEYKLSGSVRYQACNDQMCLPPRQAPFELLVRVR